MIKYQTGGHGQNLIERVEVERETDSSVWIDSRRHAKVTSHRCYFDRWQDAKDHLLEQAYREHEQKQIWFQSATRQLKRVKSLTRL